ncbi:PRA1 family protein 3-like isoform X2 [Gymnodraco acuticeps]|uniref:PRA1 family protein n=1 Tax=Gymnodraco acuticeps TaxID=8218 RepID=A0A6P8TV13_GYMAC|nr:PRA1 family protein 3-like isoform X2 [Gymnodraco acuticeps]
MKSCQISTRSWQQMAKVEVTPLRSWEDFFPGSERFCKPDEKDPTRWGNRVVSNLLYYQTNYIAIALVAFIFVGCLNPEGMFAAMALGSAIFLGSVWAADNQDFIGSLKRVNPVVFGIGLTVTSYILLCMLGSIMCFLSAIYLPLAPCSAGAIPTPGAAQPSVPSVGRDNTHASAIPLR